MTIIWRQTKNSIQVRLENSTSILKEGYNSFDFYGNGTRYFFTPPGGSLDSRRDPSDPDFTLFYVDSNNAIQQAPSPLSPKFIAGWVNDTLIGNFTNTESKSLIFIDQGREEAGKQYSDWEFAHLWRLDYQNNAWKKTDFAQELGRQFWHSSSNPLDVNNDGIQDFAISALSSAVCVLFVSNANSGEFTPISLASHLPSTNSGASALIRLANGNTAVISMPYSTDGGINGNYASIIYLSQDGSRVVSTTNLPVRDPQIASGITSIEGFSTIAVLDLNRDGLEDFIGLAESRLGTLSELKRLYAFVQYNQGQFRLANQELDIPFTYSIPLSSTNRYENGVGTRLSAIDANADGQLDILIQPDLILHSSIASAGLYGGLLYRNGKYEQLNIPASQIVFNSELTPYNYRSILPTEINSDGVVDYVLVGTRYDQEKTLRNQYGEIYNVSLLVSEVDKSGKNVISGSNDTNKIDGGPDIDTYVLRGFRKDYEVIRQNNGSVQIIDQIRYRDGTDNTTNIERFRFVDVSVAVDLDGNAGKVAKILGAVFGQSAVSNKSYVGIGLGYLDSGMSYEALAALAVSVTGKSSSTDVCNLLWTNVVKTTPTTADIAPFKAMLDSGQMSIGGLAALAADTSFNTTNIDLVGLSQTGLEYV